MTSLYTDSIRYKPLTLKPVKSENNVFENDDCAPTAIIYVVECKQKVCRFHNTHVPQSTLLCGIYHNIIIINVKFNIKY